MPRDLAGWKTVTDGASRLLQERASRIRLTEERLHHRRAEDAFPAIARGLSHGGGQTVSPVHDAALVHAHVAAGARGVTQQRR